MYNNDEVKLLENPETKLKELYIRLKESEKEKQDLKREQTKLVQEIFNLRSFKESI